MTSLIVVPTTSNVSKPVTSDTIYNLYMAHFHTQTFDDTVTEMIGLNLAGIREAAAMRLISQEMLLVAIAITLIVIVTLLYLRSIFISMVVNLGVGMSVGVAFFAYRIVFGWDLFPFINMMAVFLLIGIACDNVYVLFDSWYAEKARVIGEDLPEMMERRWHEAAMAVVGGGGVNNGQGGVNGCDGVSEGSTSSSGGGGGGGGGGASDNEVKIVVDEQLLPPIYVKRTKFFWGEANSKKKKNSRGLEDMNEVDKVER